MVRAPCCEKMGLKKGPWSNEEDQILISYIQKYGHGNWRALPKQAGLQRCGKSCRLRWTNYLRPDIKRGNFSKEEEDTIINLHQVLGNRWSAIAARLPGRTDNEIKNVWHTHLKKRFKSINQTSIVPMTKCDSNSPVSSQHSSELSSVTDASVTVTNHVANNKHEELELSDYFHEIDKCFWSEMPLSPANTNTECVVATHFTNSGKYDNGMDFWYNLFIRAGELPELPGF